MMLFGIRQISDSETLGRMIGDLSQSPVPTDRFMEYERLTFTVEELSVIRRVDGIRSVEAIVESSGFDRVTALRTLLVLFCHGLVKFPFRKGPEEKEGVVDLASTARASLGMTSYESKDENEEKAVAGNDFLVSPEGIYVSGAGKAGRERFSGTTEESAMEEQEALPLETPDTMASLTFDAAEVTDLNNGDVDEPFTGPGEEESDPAGEGLGRFSPSSGRPSEEDAPEKMSLHLESLADEDAEHFSGPVARAYRTHRKETLPAERGEHSGVFPAEETDDEVPSSPDEAIEEPVVPEETFREEEVLARTALSEEEALNVPACGIGAAAEETPTVPESSSPFSHEEEPNAMLSEPTEYATQEGEKEGMQDQDPGDEAAATTTSAPEKRSGVGLVYLFLLTFAVGLGVLSMTPWREALMDRLLSPSPRIAGGPAPATPVGGAVPENDRKDVNGSSGPSSSALTASVLAEEEKIPPGADFPEMPEGSVGDSPAVVSSPSVPEGEGPSFPPQSDPELQGLPEKDVPLPAKVPEVVKSVSPAPMTWEEQMAAWTRRLQTVSPARYTIQVEIGGNLAFLRQDLNDLPPESDAMLVPYQVGDWKAYTLLVGIFESRAEGRAVLQSLPPSILADQPLLKTMETIQRGLRLPE